MPPITAMPAEHVREYFGWMQGVNAPATMNQRYRSLKRFYRWLLEEGEIRENPMLRLRPPRVLSQIKEHYGTEALQRVLKACRGGSWAALRDRAAVLILLDTGVRASELTGLRMDDVSLEEQSLRATGKGSKQRLVPIGNATALALDRYLRKRPATYADCVWVSTRREAWTNNGLRICLKRRFRDAGVPFRGVHAFRRTFAIAYLEAGGSAEDLQEIAGWQSTQMVQLYTKATTAARARRAHRKLSPADRLALG
jgi:site-specific recombinase XerD